MKLLHLTVSLMLLAMAGVAPAAKPNFLVIVADDLCWRDLGYQGHPDVRTPNIDKLAGEGMRLDGMFSPAATCSPMRHSLYTGLFPIRSGAYPNHTRVNAGTKSIFTHLKDMGYRVALQNKSHVGPPASFPYEYIRGADDLTETKTFLERDAEQPWMLAYCSNDPHSPWNRGPKDYDPAKITVPPYLHDNAVTRKLLAAYFSEITQLDKQVGNLMKLLKETGRESDTVVLFVSEQGCSLPYGGKWSLYDTGIRVSAILRWPGVVKPGSRSNALMQYVDVAPTFIELAGGDPATVDTGCPDADGKRGFDGRSFASLLRDGKDSFREVVFGQHTTVGVHGFQEPYPSRMARDARYKLILNLAPENTFFIGGIHKGQPLASWKQDAESDPELKKRVDWLFHRPAEELYDLEKDPFEMHNLADDPARAGDKARLRKELDEWMRQQKDEGMKTETEATEHQGKADKPAATGNKQPKRKQQQNKKNQNQAAE